jgi:hypothetical protein
MAPDPSGVVGCWAAPWRDAAHCRTAARPPVGGRSCARRRARPDADSEPSLTTYPKMVNPSVALRTLVDERGRALPLDRIDGGEHPVSKVKSKLDGVDTLVRDVGAHPWAHLEAGYWRVQVEGGPVLGYVMRHRAELGDPFTFEVHADARNELG